MSRRRVDHVLSLCRRVISLDPNYAQAWALLARCITVRGADSGATEEAWAAADRALALDPELAEAHAVRGWLLTRAGRYEEASPEIERSLQLDPLSADANRRAGVWAKAMRRFADASRYLEVAGRLDPHDMISLTMAAECRLAVGDAAGAQALARQAVSRAEAAIAMDSGDGLAMAEAVGALVVLGEVDRARDWAEHAKLLEPDDVRLRYNMCCAMVRAGDTDYGIELLEEALRRAGPDLVRWTRVDNGLDPIREDARFLEIVAQAEARWFQNGRQSPQPPPSASPPG